MFNKNYGKILNKKLLLNILKILIASMVMLVVIIIMNQLTANLFIINNLLSEISKAVIGALFGGICYLIVLYITKFDFKLQ